jgi:hypothetical protein
VTAEQTIRFLRIAALAVSLVGSARAVSAQAFLPSAGEGNVVISYQNLRSDGHLDLNGDRMTGDSGHDPTQGHAILMEAEFGLTDRIAISASLPYIGSKYEGTHPHLVMGVGPPQDWDDGKYHGTFQDFRVGLRYSIVRRPLAITPSVDVIIPSHHYPSLAHAAVGKDLRAYVVGAGIGSFLDALLPRLFFQTQVSYAWVQEVIGIRPNRSRLDSELGYFITPRLSIRLLESYQVTHDGIDLESFTPMTTGVFHNTGIPLTSANRRYHDQLQRSNYLTFGGGGGFALNDSLEVFVDAARMVWGENVHPLRGMTVGVSTHFSTRRTARH